MRKAKDAAAAAPRVPPLTSDEVRALLAGQLTLPPVSLVQKLAAPLVLLVLLVMVLCYLALIVAVAGLAFWLATSEWGASVPPAVRWVAVGLAGLALGCLLRPLLMPQERSQRTLPMPLKQEPVLAELLTQIGKHLDAPLPDTLIVECVPGRSLDRSGRTLKLGLGLVAGLSVGQFAGLLAVLLAQHRRRAGTGPTNLVRAINGWMWRCVFREDRLDQWITRANLRPGFHAGRLLLPLRPLSYLVRMVLWVPMFIGNTIAAALVRRAELDADRCAARLIGRTAFGELQDRIKLVDYTWDGIQAELAFLFKEQRLPASLPDEVAVRLEELSPDLAHTLLATVIKPEEIPFDSRPTDEERLEAVASEPAAGIVASNRPATAAWSDFDKLARELTFQDYSRAFGAQHIKPAMVARR
ncbi:MAG: hypothetical protein MUF06_10465 [Pirellulaceae bacterium]|nr:hypothetical protein [Pirellulaceae bacterium]